jgi:shikimate dehydrogenase
MERLFGLIGYPLTHSFSKKYFTKKFEIENIKNCKYELFPIEKIEIMPNLFNEYKNLEGLNVTIPYKTQVIQFLDELDKLAEKINAVNVIKKKGTRLIGYNSDYYGFKFSLLEFLGNTKVKKALVLGSGGASKAVIAVLQDLDIDYHLVSRSKKENTLTYQELSEDILKEAKLIINTTPLGTYPQVSEAPQIPYKILDNTHFLYDLVYNPEITCFMKNGMAVGASVSNGYRMLVLQAEKAWEIWNNPLN